MEASQRLLVERLGALLITAVALALFINGSFFSAWDALHVDLSINLTAAHALRDGEDPYGPTTLRDRAEALHSPTNLIYTQLFTSYIQPPTSALSLLPLTVFDWRDATHIYLVLNHVFLFAAIGLSIATIRPSLPLRWVIAVTSVILLLYSQINASFALGQVDATVTLLLVVALWGYTRRKDGVTGVAIALAAAIKLIPALLLLYFLWKREYKVVAWGAGAGLALLLVSLLYTGSDTYESYLTDTLPALAKGSTQYANAGFGAAIARADTPEIIGGQPALFYLDEVPLTTSARVVSAAVGLGALAALAFVVPRSRASGGGLFWEFYLIVTVALLISSVTWEFYVIWLLPLFLAVLLAPDRLPLRPSGRWVILGVLAFVLLALNLPGDCASSRDCYLFEPNSVFYHPKLVTGVWVEDIVGLYRRHVDAVLYLRLPALLLLAFVLGRLVWLERDVSAGAAADTSGVSPS
jgi:uncharacterized membrane protein